MKRGGKDEDLLAELVDRFVCVKDLKGFGIFGGLGVLKRAVPQSALDQLYSKLGLSGLGSSRLPVLFEKLITSYCWSEVEIGSCRLHANSPCDDLMGLAEQMMLDRGLWDTLNLNGYVQFGRAPNGNYDPVCFDLRNRRTNRDCPVVQIDHEQILCNHRIRVVAELAPNFRSFVQRIIASDFRTNKDD